MKALLITSALVTSLGLSTLAQADTQSISLGYAQSKIPDNATLKGVNVKYRYEWENPVSLITSFTYLSGDETFHGPNDDYTSKDEGKYYSLTAGPAYRFNEYVSAYALLGVNHVKVDEKFNNIDGYSETATFKSTTFAYGLGVQINPVDNVVIDVGYEGAAPSLNSKRYAINGFNIGIGYRF